MGSVDLVYNAAGYFEPNDRNAYSVNNITAAPDAGRLDHGPLRRLRRRPAQLPPIMDGWNYAVRLYRPRPEILDGGWTFPDPVAVP